MTQRELCHEVTVAGDAMHGFPATSSSTHLRDGFPRGHREGCRLEPTKLFAPSVCPWAMVMCHQLERRSTDLGWLTSRAFGDYQRDVVGLLIWAESSGLVGNCCQQLRRRQLTMLTGGFQQALFAKFLSLTIQRFRNTIAVKQHGRAWSQFAFFHGAIPFVEQAHHGAGCAEPFHSVVAAQKQGRRMAAVRVAQLACAIIVFGEEESSVIPTCRVFVKQLIHRAKKSFGLFPSGRGLAAQSGLEIGHEQSGSDAFASYVRYYQA